MIEASVWTEKLDLAGMFALGRSLVARAAAWSTADRASVAVRYVCGMILGASLVLGATSGAYALVVTDDFSDGTDGAAAIVSPPANNPAPASPPNVTGPIWTHLNGELVSSEQSWDATTGQLRLKAPDNRFIAYDLANQFGFGASYVNPAFGDFSASVDLVEPAGSPGAVASGYLVGLMARSNGDNSFTGLNGYLLAYNQSLNGVP